MAEDVIVGRRRDLGYNAPVFESSGCDQATDLMASTKTVLPDPTPRSPAPEGRTSRSGPALVAWALGSCLLLLFPLTGWLKIPSGSRLSLPSTPMDNTNLRYVREWSFLWQVREELPPGASYTVRAPDPSHQWSLFVISLGVLDRQTAMPARYFDAPQPEMERQARFVLDYGCQLTDVAHLRQVARFAEGCLHQRSEEDD